MKKKGVHIRKFIFSFFFKKSNPKTSNKMKSKNFKQRENQELHTSESKWDTKNSNKRDSIALNEWNSRTSSEWDSRTSNKWNSRSLS